MWTALDLSRDRMPLAGHHYRTFEEIERPGIAATASILFHDSISSKTYLLVVVQHETAPPRVGIYPTPQAMQVEA